MFLLRVIQALEEYGVAYAVAGGFAVALHGAVRGTLDIDLVLAQTEKNYIQAEKSLFSLGLKPRLPVDAKLVYQFRKEYIEKRNLVAWSFFNPDRPSEIVDILITKDLRKMRTRSIPYGRFRIRILAIEALIAMKEETDRPQDQADVKALREILRKKRK
jgi:hypothetical protein